MNETDDLAACHAQLRAGSKSFAAAALLLPRELRDAATVLYAFCREADDLVDIDQGQGDAIATLRGRLDRIYARRPDPSPADRGMALLIAQHGLPRIALEALIEGFAWDAGNRRYETLEALHEYAARVAGTVGAMMAVLMGVRSPEAIARACELGVAMQLSNIARDVGEDAVRGRLYLPLAWLREAGIEPEAWLAAPRYSAALASVVSRLLGEAARLYAGVDAGIALLPPNCRPAINAARRIYAEIGAVVARNRFDSVSQRAVVGRPRKVWLLLLAFKSSPAATLAPALPLPACGFLVDTIATPARLAIRPSTQTPSLRWWQLRSRWLWVIELFERMERRERIAAIDAAK